VITGVGKAPAAAAIAAVLSAGRHGGVLNLGIAGSLPVAQALPLCSPIVASAHTFADEGVAIPSADGVDSFLSLASMGFPPPGTSRDAVSCDTVWTEILRRHLPSAAFGPIATVSTCSGVDSLARAVAARTGASAEAMEGAAMALASRNLDCRFAEVRTISNTTGDRSRQVWDLRGALSRLGSLLTTPR
jgi:futalosine hydrolase